MIDRPRPIMDFINANEFEEEDVEYELTYMLAYNAAEYALKTGETASVHSIYDADGNIGATLTVKVEKCFVECFEEGLKLAQQEDNPAH